MSVQDLDYHRQRADHCRSLALQARDPEIRRRHEQLAELHTSRLNSYEIGPADAVLSAP